MASRTPRGACGRGTGRVAVRVTHRPHGHVSLTLDTRAQAEYPPRGRSSHAPDGGPQTPSPGVASRREEINDLDVEAPYVSRPASKQGDIAPATRTHTQSTQMLACVHTCLSVRADVCACVCACVCEHGCEPVGACKCTCVRDGCPCVSVCAGVHPSQRPHHDAAVPLKLGIPPGSKGSEEGPQPGLPSGDGRRVRRRRLLAAG